MLNELTNEQKSKFPYYVEKWAKIGNSVVDTDFYTENVLNIIKDGISAMYRMANKKIERENIVLSSSPKMSPFVASAHFFGKAGVPKKEVRYKHGGNEAIARFLNGFSNPKEIIKHATSFCSNRYWLSVDANFSAFIEFFERETPLGDNELAKYAKLNEHVRNLTMTCYDALMSDGFCVVSKKPISQDLDLDTSGAYPIARNGFIVWGDGTQSCRL